MRFKVICQFDRDPLKEVVNVQEIIFVNYLFGDRLTTDSWNYPFPTIFHLHVSSGYANKLLENTTFPINSLATKKSRRQIIRLQIFKNC